MLHALRKAAAKARTVSLTFEQSYLHRAAQEPQHRGCPVVKEEQTIPDFRSLAALLDHMGPQLDALSCRPAPAACVEVHLAKSLYLLNGSRCVELAPRKCSGILPWGRAWQPKLTCSTYAWTLLPARMVSS